MSTFESTQSVQVNLYDKTNTWNHELEVMIELMCTAPSAQEIPASLSQPGEPGEAPEFELETIALYTDEMIPSSEAIPEIIFRRFVGTEIVEALIARATTEAIESGEF